MEFILFEFFGFLIRLMPLALVQSFGRFLGTVGYFASRERRGIAIDNLQHAFPEKSQEEIAKIGLDAFRNYGMSISEFLWFPKLTPERLRKLVRFSNVELIGEAYSRKKSLIYLSGHFGNWELGGLSLAHFGGYPLTIIVQRQRNPYVDAVINRYRCLWGNSVVPMELSVREILRSLSIGRAVAIAADQSAPKGGIHVPFFGRATTTAQGPAIFSLRTGAPILMVFLIRRENRRYEAILEEVKTDDLKIYSEENVVELTRRHTALLEKYVRMYPEQWLWMHRRWKHVLSTPKDEPVSVDRLIEAET